MRRRRILVVIVTVISLWIAGTYLIFDRTQNCPTCLKDGVDDNPEEFSQVNILESKIEELVKINSRLFKDIKRHINQVRSNVLVDKIRVLNSYAYLDSEPHATEKTELPLDSINKSFSLGGAENALVVSNRNDPSEKDLPDELLEETNSPVSNGTQFGRKLQQANRIIATEEMRLSNLAGKTVQGRPVMPVLVFSCNRVTVKRCIDDLLRYRPSKKQFPIIVSQDCWHKPTTDVINSYGDAIHFIRPTGDRSVKPQYLEMNAVGYYRIAKHYEWTLKYPPDKGDIVVPLKEKKFKGYFKIARHYGWALNETLINYGFSNVIIVEDDLEISADFFEYFLGTYWLLKADPTIMCISAWNDNGHEGLVDQTKSELLYRTDFFPGLGWMLTRELWKELSGRWPLAYWDDWIRQPSQRKNRVCIRPEVSRTKTFGKVGVSNGMFFEKHLKFIKLNSKFVHFTNLDLSYLLKSNYDANFARAVQNSPVVSVNSVLSARLPSNRHSPPIRIVYRTRDEFKRAAKLLGLMDDFRSGVPRTAYRGVVSFFYYGRRVYLAPSFLWKEYNTSWS